MQIVSLLNWSDPDTTWLTITDIALGVIVIVCAAVEPWLLYLSSLSSSTACFSRPTDPVSVIAPSRWFATSVAWGLNRQYR